MDTTKGPFCQSCGMPMEKPEDFGTDADGFWNNDYCRFCFKDGCFTEPHIAMGQMIDKVAGMAAKMNMTETQAKKMAKRFIPKLKRWRLANLIAKPYTKRKVRIFNPQITQIPQI